MEVRDKAGKILHSREDSDQDFSSTDLRGADMARHVLEGFSFDDADLRDADLSDADLYWARLFRANCEGASFKNARFNGAMLEEANFRRADLRNADLSFDNLGGCSHLKDADLSGADLRGANLIGADCPESVWRALDTTWKPPSRMALIWSAEAWCFRDARRKLRHTVGLTGGLPNGSRRSFRPLLRFGASE
jgi:uncharacterized protein YjbI with pentapeptide repeats